MAKKLIPHKIVVSFNPDGTADKATLQYRVMVDGVLSNRYNTIAVKTGITLASLNLVLGESRLQAEVSEKIRTTESALQAREDLKSGR
jgi:hypothetical protein